MSPRARLAALRRSVVLGTLLVAAVPLRSAAQADFGLADAPGHGRWSDAVGRSRTLVQEHLARLGVPGASVAVAVDGRVVWAEGFGQADVENHVAVTAASRFRIASISKALTAAAVGKLVEGGRIDLDAPVQRYVPSFPEKPQGTITTRLLAGHLAGVRHYRDLEFQSAVHWDDVVEALSIFENDPLLSPPGERYSYSTYGWNLISAVVQEASGEKFLGYMYDQVLEPLGLHETVAEWGDSIIFGRVRQYQRGRDGRLVNAPFVDNSNKWAGGGYLSTASDLVRYGSAYLEPGFLEPETVRMMWTSQRTADGKETGYGIGWFVGDVDGRHQVWHTGGAVGGSTILLILPAERVVVSVLTNLETARPTEPARAIAGLFAAAAGGGS